MRLFSLFVGLTTGLLLLLSSFAIAAERGQIRLGDDYSILTVPRGEQHRWCARACDKDQRCRSWSFIKPSSFRANAQCRLKHSVAPAFANTCCVSGVKKENKQARNSLEGRCARYARIALEQQDNNLAKKCGYRGGRWHADYGLHYRWCLKTPNTIRNKERLTRRNKLDHCASHRETLNPGCQRYAGIAVAQFEAASNNSCGLRGDRWTDDFDAHYKWCQGVARTTSERENDARERKISSCLARGGGRYDDTCNAYAETAVEQQKTALKRDCNFSGTRWSKSYKAHYQWCAKVGPFDRKAEEQAREKGLDRCMSAGGGSAEGRMACEHFARIVVAQSVTSQKLNCGFSGALWRTEARTPYRWCVRNSRIVRDNKTRAREEKISRCISRGGGAFNVTCDEYANTAISQYGLANKRGCSFRGNRWHENYIEHYRWCTKARPAARNRQNRLRKRALRLCKFGKAFGLRVDR